MRTILIFIMTASSLFAWEPSSSFIAYIKQVEGYRSTVYYIGGHPHIGYGHRITSQDDLGMILTEGGATRLLIKDLKAAYSRYTPHSRMPVSAIEAEIAVDFIFNGCPPRQFPKFFAALKRGDMTTMRREYKRYYHENGVKRELVGRNNMFYNRYLR